MNAPSPPGPAETYERYFGPAIFTPWAAQLLEVAAPRAGARVLDLACGTGIVARAVAPLLGAQGHVLGLDKSPDMLAVAAALPRPAGAAIEWRQGDASALELPAASFDLVLCQQGLQFFPDRAAAVQGVRRVLVDGGRAVFAVWRGLASHPLFEALFAAEAACLGVDTATLAVPFSLADGDVLRGLFVDAGFDRVDVEVRSMDVRFPDPDRFVALTVLAGAAVIPGLADADPVQRDALVAEVAGRVAPVLARHRHGDHLIVPMTTHIVDARA